jgi:hypothetical protein
MLLAISKIISGTAVALKICNTAPTTGFTAETIAPRGAPTALASVTSYKSLAPPELELVVELVTITAFLR